MPGNVFISYRRRENPKDARALYERLRRELGDQHVFIDLEGIDPGEDFVETLERQLDGCAVLVALIGRDWADARDERGNPLLFDESDFVRIELRTALKRGIRVIPVLVDGAAMPGAQQLPEDLRPLVRRQAVALDFQKFDTDVGRVVRAVRRAVEDASLPVLPPGPQPRRPSPASPSPPPPPSRRRPAWIWAGVAGLPVAWLIVTTANQRSTPAPAERFRDCDDAACPWLVPLGEGSFTMGSPFDEKRPFSDEGPQRIVKIGSRLAFTETEVTRGQFRAFVAATKRATEKGCWSYKGGKWAYHADLDWQDPGFDQTDAHPVVCVNWDVAQAYAQWLSRKSGQRYLLPTEAQWEFAARAGSSTRFSFGDDDSELCIHANVADRTARATFPDWTIADCSDGVTYTAPVRRYKPNAWGLYDMHGNASEWIQDCYRNSYDGAPIDGSSAEVSACGWRVLRGGAWSVVPRVARSASRDFVDPANRNDNAGIRLVRLMP